MKPRFKPWLALIWPLFLGEHMIKIHIQGSFFGSVPFYWYIHPSFPFHDILTFCNIDIVDGGQTGRNRFPVHFYIRILACEQLHDGKNSKRTNKHQGWCVNKDQSIIKLSHKIWYIVIIASNFRSPNIYRHFFGVVFESQLLLKIDKNAWPGGVLNPFD